MTQTATSKRGHAVSVSHFQGHEEDGKYVESGSHSVLHVDGEWIGDFPTGMAARAKAAEVTDDIGLIWETQP